MIKKIVTLLFIVLLCAACKDDKNNNPTVVKQPQKKETPKALKRPEINIAGLGLHHTFNLSSKNSEKNEHVGEFTVDRFKEEKGSFSIDGVSDYAIVFDNESLNSTDAFTISIWYKPDSFRGTGNNAILWKNLVFNKPDNPQYFISTVGDLYPSIPGTLKFGLSINGKLNIIKTKPKVWTPNNWYNIIARYNGEKMELYINSKLFAKRDVKGPLDVVTDNGGDVYFGRLPQKEFYTPGVVDDFRFYKRAITDSEIRQLASEN